MERNGSHSTLRIGQVARRTGVSVQTVRFYEREGLLPPAARSPSGYREYPPSAVERIRFIRRARELGFTLREIGELFALRVAPGCTCGDVKARVLGKVADVEARIVELERIREALLALADACAGTGPTAACPILDALEGRAVTSAAPGPEGSR